MIKGKKFNKTGSGSYSIDLDYPQKQKSAIKNEVKTYIKDYFDIILPGVNPVVQTSWDNEDPAFTGLEYLEINIKKQDIKECISKISGIDYEIYLNEGTLNQQLEWIAEKFKKVYEMTSSGKGKDKNK